MSAQGNGKIFSIELGKFAAAFGVAMIHLAPNTPAAEFITEVGSLFPVYFFYASALHFTVRRTLRTENNSISRSLRVDRVLVPYFVWTAIYLALRIAKNAALPPVDNLSGWFGLLFLGQSALHLYFIPQLVFFQVVAVASVRVFTALANRRLDTEAIFWSAAAAATGLWIHSMGWFGWKNCWLNGLLYTGLGLFSVRMQGQTGTQRTLIRALSLLMMLALAMTAAMRLDIGSIGYFLRGPLFGCATLVLLLHVRVPQPQEWLVHVASCYFGIYLCHHAIEEGMEMFFARIGHELTPYGVASRVLVTLATVAMGVLFTLAVRRFPPMDFFLLGERKHRQVIA